MSKPAMPKLEPGDVEITEIAHIVVPYTRGKVLALGGSSNLFPHFVTLDRGDGYGDNRMSHLTGDGVKMPQFVDGSWDAVFGADIIEKLPNWREAVQEWWRIIRDGGHLVLHWRNPELIRVPGRPDIYPRDVIDLARELGARVVEDDCRAPYKSCARLVVLRKQAGGRFQYAPWRKPGKNALVIRLGAFGDNIIAASVLPELKKQGYHITFNGQPPQIDVLRCDPNIDEFMLQDRNQVPVQVLGPFHKRMLERYDRVIDLSGSIEDLLLTGPQSLIDKWPDDVRHKICDVNYMERTHDIAGVPHVFHQKFYPTKQEAKEAEDFWASFPPGPRIFWQMNGSHINKYWARMPAAAIRILNETNGVIFFSGDKDCQHPADGIATILNDMASPEIRQRVKMSTGQLTLRQVLAMAQQADVVIGQETGVLNGVAMEPNRKIVFLSHSTVENLTKHWVNTESLVPTSACFPCHRMHYDWSRCHLDKAAGMAACQASIKVDQVIDAVKRALAPAAAGTDDSTIVAFPQLPPDETIWGDSPTPDAIAG